MKIYKIDDQIVFSDKTLSVGTELIANTTDGAQEKHVPVITISGDEASRLEFSSCFGNTTNSNHTRY